MLEFQRKLRRGLQYQYSITKRLLQEFVRFNVSGHTTVARHSTATLFLGVRCEWIASLWGVNVWNVESTESGHELEKDDSEHEIIIMSTVGRGYRVTPRRILNHDIHDQ